MELFEVGFLTFKLTDLIDVVVVSALIYKMFVLIKGTRTAQMAIGLALLIVVAFLAYWFQMEALTWLFTNVTTFGLLALVILFQPELRGILANIGLSGPLKTFGNAPGRRLIVEISMSIISAMSLRISGFKFVSLPLRNQSICFSTMARMVLNMVVRRCIIALMNHLALSAFWMANSRAFLSLSLRERISLFRSSLM